MAEGKKSVVLSGVVAGRTAICTVGREGKGLHYRGYDIRELAEQCELRRSRLPAALRRAAEPIAARKASAAHHRRPRVPGRCSARSRRCPPSAHPMDVLRTACSFIGCVEPETNPPQQQHRIAERLLATFPSMLMYWYQFHRGGHPHRHAQRRADDRRALPATAASQAAERTRIGGRST